jgi:hypothetical protein
MGSVEILRHLLVFPTHAGSILLADRKRNRRNVCYYIKRTRLTLNNVLNQEMSALSLNWSVLTY